MRRTALASLITAVMALPGAGAVAGVTATTGAQTCASVSSPAGDHSACASGHATTHGDHGDPDVEVMLESGGTTGWVDTTPVLDLGDTLVGGVLLRACDTSGGAACADWQQVRDDLRSLND